MVWCMRQVTYSSDYFTQLHALAVKLIKSGHAYVDHQTAEEIKASRSARFWHVPFNVYNTSAFPATFSSAAIISSAVIAIPIHMQLQQYLHQQHYSSAAQTV